MQHASGLEDEMTSRDAQVVCRETVAAIPATGVTLVGTDVNDPHEPGGQLPKRRLVPLINITVP